MRSPAPTLAALGLFLPLVGCGAGGGDAGSPAPPRPLVLANVHVDGYPTAEALRSLARAVAADPTLGAAVRFDLQLGGVLGNEKEVLEKVALGAVAATCTGAAPLAQFAPDLGVLSLPYLFRDAAHQRAVLEGPIGAELAATLEPAGLVALAWYDAGARSFYVRDRPVLRLADLAGRRIRVQKSRIMSDTVAALGASPVAMGFKDVWTNLQTGALDGAENNLPSYRSERHFEVAPFYSLDRHSMVPDVLVVSKSVWDGLAPEVREGLRDRARASSEEQRELWRATVAESEAALAAEGVEIREVEDPEAFRAAVEGVYAEHAAQWVDLVERIRAVEPEPAPEAPAEPGTDGAPSAPAEPTGTGDPSVSAGDDDPAR